MFNKVKSPTEFSSLIEMITYFKDEKTCLKYIEQVMWGGIIDCPYCGNCKIYRYRDGINYKCAGCSGKFSLKVGTIFESSKIPLVKWFTAIYMLCVNTRGCSSYQLAKQLGTTQKTGWFMAHRIRKAFITPYKKLSGVVAVDECFCGGANINRHIDKKVKNRKDRTFKDKHTVVGFISNDRVVCEVIPSVKVEDLIPCVMRTVEKGSVVVTDEWPAYKRLNYEYVHSVVSHHERKFVSTEGLSTNKVENMWSHLKRMFYGTYNWVSKKHVQRYVDEFTFRFNNREYGQSFKVNLALFNIKGSLPYKKLVYGNS